MPDVRKVNSGQPLKFVAEEWNRLADVANSNGVGGAIGEGLSVPACLVRVNVYGGALPAGSIIVPVENLITDAFKNRETPVLRCATPNGNPHALMLVEPYNGRNLAAAVVSGCTWCNVNVISTSHRYANPVSGDSDKLRSSHTGTVAILQPPVTTGEQYLFVCFSVADAGRRTIKGKLDGALALNGSATLSVWEWNGSAEADTTENITIYDFGQLVSGSLPTGTSVETYYDINSARWYL